MTPVRSCAWLRALPIKLAALSLSLALLAPEVLAEPWRLQDQGLPDWLHLSGQMRYRVELMDNTFRAVDPGRDQMTTSRILLAAEARGERWFAGAELQDSRAWWNDDRTPLATDDVNAGEFLQAYLGARGESVMAEGDELAVYAGRMTLSMGNKRVVARNVYRNTINGFVGLRLAWRSRHGERVQAFYTSPTERLPDNTDRRSLRDNDIENDEYTWDRILWGIEFSRFAVAGESLGDLYLVGYKEDGRPSQPVRKRDHLTLGGRLYKEEGPWQWEVEAAWQWGDSRATPLPTDTNDQDHGAGLFHAELTRAFEGSRALRLFAKYTFASGDGDFRDDKSERFDTLFAARRRDFGLLGLYGPFFYANLQSAAVGFKSTLRPGLKFESSYRPAWLADKRDVFFGTRVVDISGESGDFLGHQFDARLDWELVPGQVFLMFGAAYLNKGEFLKDAPTAPDNGDTVYGVSQVRFFF